MTVKVKFFAYFRGLFGGRVRIFDLPAGTAFGRLLDLLGDTSARREELFDSEAGLKPHLVVLINGNAPAAGEALEAELRDGDVVSVFPLMGGG